MNYCSILDAWGNKNNTEGNKNNTEQNLDSNIKEVQGTSLIEQSFDLYTFILCLSLSKNT